MTDTTIETPVAPAVPRTDGLALAAVGVTVLLWASAFGAGPPP